MKKSLEKYFEKLNVKHEKRIKHFKNNLKTQETLDLYFFKKSRFKAGERGVHAVPAAASALGGGGREVGQIDCARKSPQFVKNRLLNN